MSTNNRSPSIEDDDDETLKPKRKKLRSCEPDLKITVGGAVEGCDPVVYWYHASVMATHSNYIDIMLASGMKESNNYAVSFPDIAPTTWESMMKFLDTPLAGRLMTVEDVIEVAPCYDKYDFSDGRELSGHVLMEYIKVMKKVVPDNLDFFIDAILLADSAQLDEALNAGVLWIENIILHYDKNIFSRDHITKLAPLFANEESLFATVKLFVKSVVSKDDILHRLFPELFVEKLASYQKVTTILDLVGGRPPLPTSTSTRPALPVLSSRPDGFNLKVKKLCITLSGSGGEDDGEYIGRFLDNRPNALEFQSRSSLSVHSSQRSNFLKIIVRDEIWAIVRGAGNNEKIIWKCPHSRTLMLPPRDGWVPVDQLARGMIPTLKYLMHAEK
jgi:hypothetical protein